MAGLRWLEDQQAGLVLDAFGDLRQAGRVLRAGSGRGGTVFMLHDRFGRGPAAAGG